MIDLSERRAHERDACAIAAKIELAERLAVAVALTDISPGGVRLRVADGAHLPDEFDLLIPLLGDLEQRCRIKTVWRRDGEVGGAFLSIGVLAADADARAAPPGGKRLASVKETGEEIPPEEWERFEAAEKKTIR